MADDLRRREIVRSRRALSRALTRVSRARIDELLALSSGRDAARQGRSVAVTGPAGVGKSTLIARLAPLRLARARAEDPARADLLAVLAIDPSSPVSGGAILGDRVRMDAVADDLGLFLRSIASGGAYGGLSRDIVSLVTATLDHGFAEVIVETVGAGQSDVAAADLAETVVLVLQPDSGDMVQAMKSGIMEIADIYVVNKAGQPAAARTVGEVEALLKYISWSGQSWHPPVIPIAQEADMARLDAAIEAHRTALGPDGIARRHLRREKLWLSAMAARRIDEVLNSENFGSSGEDRRAAYFRLLGSL